jgi:hypothetical protein
VFDWVRVSDEIDEKIANGVRSVRGESTPLVSTRCVGVGLSLTETGLGLKEF